MLSIGSRACRQLARWSGVLTTCYRGRHRSVALAMLFGWVAEQFGFRVRLASES